MVKVIDEKKQFFVISIETFDVEIAFFINYSPIEAIDLTSHKKKLKELNRMLKEENFDTYNYDSSAINARMLPLERGYAVFIKNYKDSFRMNLCNAQHEISHLVSWILLDRRIPLNKDTDEVYAYLTSEITRKYLYKLY